MLRTRVDFMRYAGVIMVPHGDLAIKAGVSDFIDGVVSGVEAGHSLLERQHRPLLDHVDAVALATGLDQQPRWVRPRHSMRRPCKQTNQLSVVRVARDTAHGWHPSAQPTVGVANAPLLHRLPGTL